MRQELQAGASFEIKEYVKDHSEPITLPDAIRIVGPRSKIVDSKISPPAGMEMSLHSGELPAGMFVSTMLQVENLESTSAVQLSCENQENAPMMVHIGDRSPNANLQQIGPDQLFLSFNTSGLPTGCVVRAVIDNGPDGASEPYRLGYIVRMPLIDSFKLTDESCRERVLRRRSDGHGSRNHREDGMGRYSRQLRSGIAQSDSRRRTKTIAANPHVVALSGAPCSAVRLVSGRKSRPRDAHP